MDGQMDGWILCMDGLICGFKKWINGQMDGWMDRWMDRWIYEQIDDALMDE